MKFLFFLFSIFLFFNIANADNNVLREKISDYTKYKNAKIGLALHNLKTDDTLSINGNDRFVMQSVFKFHIAIALLSEVEKGNISLNKKIRISKEMLQQNTWSPIKTKYPNGVSLSIDEIIKYTVAQSDNIGCDILLNELSGTEYVQNFFKKYNISDLSIVYNEAEMHKEWENQFSNWTSPIASNLVLKLFFEGKILNKKYTKYLYDIMLSTSTGAKRIKGLLPAKTDVAHKTGSSGANTDGITAACNDIGIIKVNNDEYLLLSIYITDSKESDSDNELIIAELTKIIYDYYSESK